MAQLLNGTTASYGGTPIVNIYSIDGPDISVAQTDTTTLSSTVETPAVYPITEDAGDIVREYTSGSINVGPISIETDFDPAIEWAKSGTLAITWAGGGVWTGDVTLSNITVAPGAVDDAMRATIVFQPQALPVVT